MTTAAKTFTAIYAGARSAKTSGTTSGGSCRRLKAGGLIHVRNLGALGIRDGDFKGPIPFVDQKELARGELLKIALPGALF